jgi:hypothetical protein
MKKVFLTLAVVFATSAVLVSCGGDKGSANATTNEEKKDTTSVQQPAETADTTKKEVADTTKKEGEGDAKATDAKATDAKATDAKKDEKNPK